MESSHDACMMPEETQTEGIASLIAMLELMFLLNKSGYYRRLPVVHWPVTSWSPGTHSWTILMAAAGTAVW